VPIGFEPPPLSRIRRQVERLSGVTRELRLRVSALESEPKGFGVLPEHDKSVRCAS
jgi:hypothetical protein